MWLSWIRYAALFCRFLINCQSACDPWHELSSQHVNDQSLAGKVTPFALPIIIEAKKMWRRLVETSGSCARPGSTRRARIRFGSRGTKTTEQENLPHITW
ncbi:hypothetical protein EDB19DRAFT_1735365 [Suillus lakei]|nr:hypothetical protein EDB19DRAFT_1735365 [Suillus lakei]